MVCITKYGGDILEPMQDITGSEDVEEMLDIAFTILHLLKCVFSKFEGRAIGERSPVVGVGARRWRQARGQRISIAIASCACVFSDVEALTEVN